jgi:chromosomal replication initiation ATPase DnaA
MADSPFKFLDAYTKTDSDRFFGRDEEIAYLYQLTKQTNLILLYGQSGTGKTSLIQCGLANCFAETDWLEVPVRRRNDINLALEDEISKKVQTLLEPEMNSVEKVQSLYLDYLRPIYLIFDQFEELFISGNEKEQATFYQTITDILKAKVNCTVILVIREEFLAYLSSFEKVLPTLFKNRFRLEKITHITLLNVIRQMLKDAEVSIEDESVISAIAQKIQPNLKTDIEFSHLQFFLGKLYKNASLSNKSVLFTRELAEKTIQLENVIDNYLAEVVDEIDRQMQGKDSSWQLLKYLITDQNTKKMLTETELESLLSV